MASSADRSSIPTLVRRRLAVPAVDPAAVLGCFPGEIRGFWGRGDRWVAWAGSLHELRIEDDGSAANGTGADPRFARVREQAEALLAGGVEDGSAEDPDAPRFFGGFSFLAKPGSGGEWLGFPPARFVLPRVVVRGGPDGARLLAQAFDDGSGAPGGDRPGEPGVSARLDDALRRVAARLRGEGVDRRPPDPDLPPAPTGCGGSDRGGTGSGGSDDLEAERTEWRRAVTSILDGVRNGTVEKAVLARIHEIELASPPEVGDLLRFLRDENPRAHVFLFRFEEARTLFGAAPEILAELREGRLQSTAVAGSAARGTDADGDRRKADALLRSKKDLAEHRMTVEEMGEVLTPRLVRMRMAERPRILSLARIQHLESPIEGEIRKGEDVLSLIEALHPTPAVCGRPRDAALELIRSREPFSRGWYAGPVGWFDADGNGDFVPALRMGVGCGTRWRLFAGAGIVAGSDPELEWEETALKLQPALRALRAGAPVPPDAPGTGRP